MRRLLCNLAIGLILLDGARAPADALNKAPENHPGVFSAALMVTAAEGAALVDDLASFDYRQDPANAPIATLRAVPPLSVRAFHQPRPVGDFRLWIAANPDKAAAKLDRYVIAEFASASERDAALVQAATDPQLVYAHTVEIIGRGTPGAPGRDLIAHGPAAQPQHKLLNTSSAWDLDPGWALVGIADNGIDGAHPSLRSRALSASSAGTRVPGGSFLPHFSANTGSPSQDLYNLLESQPQALKHVAEGICDGADGQSDGFMHTQQAGHGTHVAGLIGSNGTTASPPVRGVCRECSVAVAKISRLICNFNQDNPRASPTIDTASTAVGLGHLVRAGAQVVNLSLGLAHSAQNQPPICDISVPGPAVEDAFCLQLRAAAEADVAVVSAAGNDRASAIDFPARDPRVVAVGGLDIDPSGAPVFWDYSPTGDLLECPFSSPQAGYVSSDECGSNYSHFMPFDPLRRQEFRQELVAPAVNIHSTIEAASTWNSKVMCGDSFGDNQSSDGYGACSGTSMSTPMISGTIGLVRSVNPLVPVGDPFDAGATPPGIRDVLAMSASRAVAGLPWDEKLGFGYPDAARASALVLGRVAGSIVRNRATPLFRLYSDANTDYADVVSPQHATALSSFQMDNYAMNGATFAQGAAIGGYAALPSGTQAKAAMYVLSTPYIARGGTVTLHLLDRCSWSGGDTCHGSRDLVLATNEDVVNRALSAGYSYAGRQGFLIAPCQPEPQCIPFGAERVHVQCSVLRNDCAVFLESEKAYFESDGGGAYTASFMDGAKTAGYAYTTKDTDADKLVDGFEALIGTSPSTADSDGDGVPDGTEYPLAGVPVSDPCSGPGPIVCPRAFKNGFEEF